MTSTKEKPKPKMKKNIFQSTRRLAEFVKDLHSSLAQSAGELWYCKAPPKLSLLQSLKVNHLDMVDIAAGNPPSTESVNTLHAGGR